MIAILLLSMMFLLSHHPLIMTLTLILSTTSVAIILTSSMSTPWFSMIITLILIGAMMVIFIYLASLAPNEKFFHKITVKSLFIFPIIMSSQLFSFSYPSQPNPALTNQLFSQNPYLPNLTLATLLFITMLAIVKITSLPEGPLKSS